MDRNGRPKKASVKHGQHFNGRNDVEYNKGTEWQFYGTMSLC